MSAHQHISLLLTDVEGSTRLWDQQPETATLVLNRHDQIAQEVAAICGVEIVKPRGEGDSLFIVSQMPINCLSAAIQLQERFSQEVWPNGVALKVRMALHCGRVESRSGDFYGGTVNRAARLRAIGHGGQILVSSAFVATVQNDLPAGHQLLDHGIHRLRDLEGPEHVYELAQKGQERQFSALKSLSTHPNNLPTVVSTFVGRVEELKSINALTIKNTLTTLTGSGGTGKTRLAMQVGADAMASFEGGVWLVELAALTEASQVVESFARSMGVEIANESDLMTSIVKRIGSSKTLLIFDNCEHLLDAVAAIVAKLQHASKHISFLCTSREPLGVSGEHVYRVPPLDLPVDLNNDQHIQNSTAVQLFVERCKQINVEFSPNSQDLATIARICYRLDGIPLAIELAAARTRVLTPTKIASLLDDRFRLLTGGSKTSLPRQQTLEATIAWSFNLLSETERELLVCLGAFGGTFSLEAAQAVCLGGMNLDEWDVLDGLTSLVDKSLIQYSAFGAEARYWLLESIRHYCLARLSDHAHIGAVRRAHALWFSDLSRTLKEQVDDDKAKDVLERASMDAENFRIAFDHWCHAESSEGQGLSMFANLARIYESMGRLREGFEIGAALLEADQNDTAVRGDVLNMVGNMAQGLGLADRAIGFYEQSLKIRREQGDQRGIAAVLNNMGNALSNGLGQFDKAEQNYFESLEINRATGNRLWEAFNLTNLGVTHERRKDAATAIPFFNDARQILEQLNNRPMTLFPLTGMGNAKLTLGEFDEALQCFSSALEICLEASNLPSTATITEGVWRALFGIGRTHDAAWILGVERQLRKSLEIPVPSSDLASHQETSDRLKASLGQAEFDSLVAQGELCDRNSALSKVLAMAKS